MGCITSQPTTPVVAKQQQTRADHSNSVAISQLMDGTSEIVEDPDSVSDPAVVFKIMPSEKEARKKFEMDGTLLKNSDAGHLMLRTMLDEPLSQNALGKFAAKIQVLDIFMCWIDIQEYKLIPTENYRRSKALHIYHKYVKDDAALMIGVTTSSERIKYKDELAASKDDPAILTPQFYDAIQTKCFLDMYYNIFLPFKQTDEYQMLSNQLKNKYNRVKLSDFDYLGKLGEGGFGFVVHVRKKSTGKHYAMKIQTKIGLLECYRDDPTKATLEKNAFAALQHPFIVNMSYAFQTPSLVAMVLDLADAGDLHSAIANSSHLRLPDERVRFYLAEIVLALAYLHQRGLIYRDLKPQNVLLNSDGHVQLVDLGGVMDDDGAWTTKQQSEVHHQLPLFAQQILNDPRDQLPQIDEYIEDNGEDNSQIDNPQVSNAAPQESKASSGADKKRGKRRQSIMGTLGYMAPEMVLLLSKPPMYGEKQADRIATKRLVKKGYSQAVDWWSLGVTAYKLLTGVRPFGDKQLYAFVDLASTMHAAVGENLHFKEYAMLFQKLSFPSYVPQAAQDFVSALLDVNETTRLGTGENGVEKIKSHDYFKGLEWDLLEQKQVEPPFVPPRSRLQDTQTPHFADLRSLLFSFGKATYMDQLPPPDTDKYFQDWDFISPHSLRVEAGLSQMMEQLVTNMKARRIMGESDKLDVVRKASSAFQIPLNS